MNEGAHVMPRLSFPCDPDRLRLLLDDCLPGQQQDDVVAHLDSCRGCQQTLEYLAAERPWWEDLRRIPDAAVDVPLATLVPESSWSAPGEGPYLGFLDPSDEPGCLGRLGPFTVTAFLGQGGMGIVLEAFDPVLDRPVAIKVLAPHFASNPAARKRFAREAQAAAAVVHPHVVPIHSVDSWKGLPYLVMSYVAGPSLQEYIACEGPLPVVEVLRIAAQAAAGLAAAHARGLVHRDVKPANILLEKETGRVLLTDFGLARTVDDAGLTQSGVIPGTPQYMAPEQARGEAVDHRSDLFSLGSTLYAMCTGRPPFGADTPLAVVRRVCEAAPPPLRSLRPDVPPWLETLIERLLARNPAARFGGTAEVAEILAGCLAHVEEPDTVALPLAARDVRPRSSRLGRRTVVGLLLAIGLGTAALLHGTRIPRPRAGAEGSHSAPEARQKPGTISPQSLEEPLDRELDLLRRRTGALEADLKGSTPEAADSFAGALGEQRRRLDAVEGELAGKQPR
jgi:serine/threonine-protein kinase